MALARHDRSCASKPKACEPRASDERMRGGGARTIKGNDWIRKGYNLKFLNFIGRVGVTSRRSSVSFG